MTWSALCCTVQRDRSRRVERAHLEVHVVVGRDEVALVLHPPLEADEDGLAREVREERLGVDGLYGVGVLMEEEAVMGGGGGEGEGEGRGARETSEVKGARSIERHGHCRGVRVLTWTDMALWTGGCRGRRNQLRLVVSSPSNLISSLSPHLTTRASPDHE